MKNAYNPIQPRKNLQNSNLKERELFEKFKNDKTIPTKIHYQGIPTFSAFKTRQKIETKNQYVNESQKRRIKSEQFSILKSIQETLNGGTKSFHRVITYEDGYSYQGEYRESKDDIILEGYGVLKYQNDIIYSGFFRDNQFHGDGICKQDNKLYNLLDWRKTDQEEIRGIFENGILIGEQPGFY
ncbi:unnamed protein product (macronuclear) [Paramecium tetraurelia]|uniref:MORN repeat protein n=1 Tax=Paramecium tetraurelia TaxID=5888 RepID=A0C8P6_PARTE|nr:uncharacterized protein GSPATT00036298001 [Paramecium tetraurelia]CAK67163.1 unnamed protein product [Paramecium tetraurelia]|eukprot:XP_001434560.1 hypothetical protein (macronuclear) [Paramecium tetraurelia strain d4-2]